MMKRIALFAVAVMFLPGCALASRTAGNGAVYGLPPTQTPWVITATPPPGTAAAVAIAADPENLYVDLYERASPSVVHVTSRTQAYDFWRGLVPQEGTGSGFILDVEGHIVTNQHVVADAEEVEVVFADGTTAKARIVGSDEYNDLAVLKVDGLDPNLLQPLPLGASSGLKVGLLVVAIGNPYGLDRTLTTGVISALGRTVERQDQAALGEMIQTDAAINPGNSGGPLLNLRGEVIGVNTSIQSPSGGSVGIGFAVPSDIIKRVVPELISQGRYEHPWLAFNAYEIDKDLADVLNLSVQKGLLIAELKSGGAAERAGVRGATQRLRAYGGYLLAGGDILIVIDGQPVYTRDAMTIYLEKYKRAGDTVELTLIRDAQEITLTATLDAR